MGGLCVDQPLPTLMLHFLCFFHKKWSAEGRPIIYNLFLICLWSCLWAPTVPWRSKTNQPLKDFAAILPWLPCWHHLQLLSTQWWGFQTQMYLLHNSTGNVIQKTKQAGQSAVHVERKISGRLLLLKLKDSLELRANLATIWAAELQTLLTNESYILKWKL